MYFGTIGLDYMSLTQTDDEYQHKRGNELKRKTSQIQEISDYEIGCYRNFPAAHQQFRKSQRKIYCQNRVSVFLLRGNE